MTAQHYEAAPAGLWPGAGEKGEINPVQKVPAQVLSAAGKQLEPGDQEELWGTRKAAG